MTRIRWIGMLSLLGLFVGCNALAVGQSLDNAKPVASFRAMTSGSISTAVLLDGTSSTDPDGSIVSYQWLFGDGTTGSGATVEHTYSQIKEFLVTLVVIDDQGASHMVTKNIDLSELERQDETPDQSFGSTGTLPPLPVPSSASVGSEVGDRAPDFTLPTLDGDIVQLSMYLGRIVIVDFWFSNCSGCISSLPHLEELRAQFEDEGLIIIILVLDHDPAQAKTFFAENVYASFILAHEHDWARPTRTAYEVRGTPHAFLVDRAGVIRFSGKPSNLTAEFVASKL